MSSGWKVRKAKVSARRQSSREIDERGPGAMDLWKSRSPPAEAGSYSPGARKHALSPAVSPQTGAGAQLHYGC